MTQEGMPSAQPRNALGAAASTVAWLCAIIPGAAYFRSYAPPDFPPAWIFGSLLGVAILLWGYFPRKRRSPRPIRAVILLSLAILMLVLYMSVLKYCTVVPPYGREGSRRQIGFYMFDWSMTPKAREKIAQLQQSDDPIEITTQSRLMGSYGVWAGKGREDELWYFWSIRLASGLLILLFVLAFGLWVYGFAVLLRIVKAQLLR